MFAAETSALLPEIRAFNPAYPQMHGSSVDLIVAPAPANEISPFYVEPVLSRLRAVPAAADDTTYDEVVRRLAGYRTGPLARRVATTYLLPTEQRWLDDDIARIRSAGITSHGLMMLLASATTAAQATAILDAAGPRAGPAGRPELVYSLAAHIGPDVAPILARFFDTNLDAIDKKRVLSVLGQLPTDTAFDLLLDRVDQKYVQPVVLEAMARFPRRAMRRLAAASADAGAGAKSDAAKQLLHDHAISHPDLVGSTRPELAPDAASAVDAAVATTAQLPAVPPERLPPLLVTPPWTVRRTKAKPVVVEPVVPPSPLRLAWKQGEQDEWAETDVGRYRQTPDWSDLVSKAVSGESWAQLKTLALAPDHLVRPHLGRIKPLVSWDADACLRRILGRFGDDAVDLVVRAAFSRPTGAAEILHPIEGSEIAIRMAEWYGKSKTIRPIALRWFERHGPVAARDLVPVALGKPGKDRTLAEQALRLIDRLGQCDAIRAAAAIQGQVAADAIDATLAMDPLEVLSARMPALPAWLDVAHLPQVLLPDRTEALPPSAVEHICTMLAISEPGATYLGIDVIRPAVDPASLAEMAWGVFERWRAAGFPSKEGWVLDALGVVGDDETVRRLAPLIKVWPGESAHRLAARYHTDSADMVEPAVVEPVVSFLATMAGDGAALEVGIGTGRIALPLSQRGVPVHGIELSPAMVERLRAKPGAEGIGVTIGDFASATVDGTFRVAYLVFNTIMNLTTQDEHVECFRNVAAQLEPGGCSSSRSGFLDSSASHPARRFGRSR